TCTRLNVLWPGDARASRDPVRLPASVDSNCPLGVRGTKPRRGLHTFVSARGPQNDGWALHPVVVAKSSSHRHVDVCGQPVTITVREPRCGDRVQKMNVDYP